MDHPLLIQSSLHGHLAFVNNAAVNVGVEISESQLSILLGLYLELLDHMVTLCLTFWGPFILFSTVAAPFYICISSAQSFQFLHILGNTLDILLDRLWYFVLVLISIFLMTNAVQYFFCTFPMIYIKCLNIFCSFKKVELSVLLL